MRVGPLFATALLAVLVLGAGAPIAPSAAGPVRAVVVQTNGDSGGNPDGRDVPVNTLDIRAGLACSIYGRTVSDAATHLPIPAAPMPRAAR